MTRLANKTALITGGTTGIGAATARLFHAEGARVIVTGTNPASLDTARTALAGIATVRASDAGSVADIDALFDWIKREHGGLDVLFLNAAIVQGAPIAALDEAMFDRMLRINVKGPLFALRAAAAVMRRGGAIVINGSVNAHVGMPGTAIYAATKGALASIARVAAAELAPAGVRVNVLSPGPTDTGVIEKMGRPADEVRAVKAALMAKSPQGRLAHPDEIARVALFLASDDSSYMTGEEIVADGGLTRV